MGNSLLWTFFFEITEVTKMFWLLFPKLMVRMNFDKKGVGQHFGRFFYKLIWPPSLLRSIQEEEERSN
jgi:hypothetical protein